MLLGIFLSMYVREPFVSHGLISCIRPDDGEVLSDFISGIYSYRRLSSFSSTVPGYSRLALRAINPICLRMLHIPFMMKRIS